MLGELEISAVDDHGWNGLEKTVLWAGCPCRCYGEYAILVDGRHLRRFSFPVIVVVLDDAQRVYPQVFAAHPPRHESSVPKRRWQ